MLELTLTITERGNRVDDDCERATLMGIVRRALQASPEFNERYAEQRAALSGESEDSPTGDTIQTGWRIG